MISSAIDEKDVIQNISFEVIQEDDEPLMIENISFIYKKLFIIKNLIF